MKQRSIANRILAAILALFGAAAILRYMYPENFAADMLFMVSEAALIGGIADWFAVTALFRRPLGFPWHTELIPRNRDRVIQSIVDVVEKDLLSAEAIKKRIAGICFMDIIIDWVDNKNGRLAVGGFAVKAAKHFLENVQMENVSERMQKAAQRYLQDTIVIPRLQAAGQWALEQGRIEQLFQFMLDELSYVVAKRSTLEAIYQYLDDVKDKKSKSVAARLVLWLGEHTNSINTREAAQALQQELISLLDELRDPEHPMHIWAVARLADNINGLADNSEFRHTFCTWAASTVEQISFQDFLARAVETSINALEEWISAGEGKRHKTLQPPLLLWLFDQAAAYWDGFKEDPDIRSWVEQYVKKALFRLIETEHYLVGRIVQDALEQFDNSALSEFIEDKAGDDLQWIRINGSIIGGLVGLILFLFLRMIYDPIVVPVIRSWIL